jgi:electron transfer flavoprotein beta subunit
VNIGVCFKSTPGTDARIKIAGDGTSLEAEGKKIISPYDEFAIEQGVLTKEEHKGEVVLFTVGGDQKNIREGLAVGADRGVLIEDPALEHTDSLGIAKALAAAIKAEGSEVVFCGKVAIDDQTGQVPAMVAEMLGWPHVSIVTSFSTDGSTFTATRAIGGGVEEVVTGPLPVLITTERGLNKPRYAKLPAIMKAKKKQLDTKSLADLGLSAADVASSVTVTSMAYPPERAKGRIIPGDATTAANELVRLLREEAKVI